MNCLTSSEILILKFLIKNPRISNKSLGNILNIDETKIEESISEFERKDLINSVHITLNPKFFGFNQVYIVILKLTDYIPKKILNQILLPIYQIENCYAVDGNLRLLLKIRVRNNNELSDVVENISLKMKCLNEINTMICYDEILQRNISIEDYLNS